MKTVAIIQSRLGSTRFPRKALADLHGRPLILHVVDRVAHLRGLDALVVAIPAGDEDLYRVLDAEAVPVVRGDEYDVLGRVAKAATVTQAGIVIRVTGDCPLWEPAIGEAVLALYHRAHGCDYAWNITNTYLDGTDTEVFSRPLLDRAAAEAIWPHDREHVTPFLRRHARHVATLPTVGDWRGQKTSVDTVEDLARVAAMGVTV